MASKLAVPGRAPVRVWRRLLSPLLCLVALLPLPHAAASSVIRHLPGFDGPLPFHLETGYVGVDDATGTELFYYFVESVRSPATDAVILWLTGGPRCSVLCGLALEIGPIKFVLKPYDGTLPELALNPNSWTKVSSILFVDSPVGSGFSFARDPEGYDVGDLSSSMQLVTFLRKWFQDHPQYISNPFYVGGDSYAGKVVPLIAYYVAEGNQELQQPPLINLKGYIAGNPLTGDDIDVNSRVTAAHSFGVISDQLYEAAMKNCEGDYVSPKNKLCANVLQTINDLMSEVNQDNVLDNVCHDDVLKRKSLLEESFGLDSPPDEPPLDCFALEYTRYLSYFWANNNATQVALGIKEGTFTEWIRCKRHAGLPYSFDLPSSIEYHFNLTTRSYRALVYNGDHDLTIPFCGTQAWVRSFNFPITDDWRAWRLYGQAAGFTVTYNNKLTYATVKGGRHVAVENRPEQCFAMVQRWLDKKPL